MTKKRILISAAGTASAFHLAEMIQTRFSENFSLYLCDINPSHLVPSATFATKFFTVPLAADPAFRRTMFDIFATNQIDIYVPLVDLDVYLFPADDPALIAANVHSTSPPRESVPMLQNKRSLMRHLSARHLSVPHVFTRDEVASGNPALEYFVKPENGWGSRDALIMTGRQIMASDPVADGKTMLIQEVCRGSELTVEVYNDEEDVRAICRERLETKAGVCTKARVCHCPEMTTLAKRLCEEVQLPVAFCFQVMRNSKGQWAIIDLNPRLGSGTALSTACGWSLASAALANWGRLSADPLQWLTPFSGDRFAIRAFREFRTL